jgi:putative two-component system response regulator
MFNTPTTPAFEHLILVVDDNQEIRDIITQSLELEGYATIQGENGLEGLDHLKSITPDLILSDINMPKMGGIEFFRNVRNNPSWTTIPFVFLTSHSTPEDIQKGRELGVEDYLTKPIETDNLVKIINARLYRVASVEVAQVGKAYLDTVKVLANAIESRDRYTRGHVERVTRYSLWMAQALKWPSQHIRMLEFGARLHDIGKILIPGSILNKPGHLNEKEWELMKKHPLVGAKMLQNIPHLKGTLPYILYHHEKWDGSGYPKGLMKKDIPIQGRILALADAYDAMASSRPYQKPRSHEETISVILTDSGSHFDPDLTPIFVKIMNDRIPKTKK